MFVFVVLGQMERALEDAVFSPVAWARFASRRVEDDEIALEEIHPAPLQKAVLWVLDAAVEVIERHPDRIMSCGMVETSEGVRSADVACPAVSRLSPVALIERLILARYVRDAPRRYFYAEVLKHVVNVWLYELAHDLCDADTARVTQVYQIDEIFDWQNAIRAGSVSTVVFLRRVRDRLASMHPSALLREAMQDEFAVPLKPPPPSPGLRYVWRDASVED